MQYQNNFGWRDVLIVAPFLAFYTCLIFWSRNFSFFWDAVQLSSAQAHWYFDNQFQYFFLPTPLDSGHPPLMGMMLALAWTIFGRSLPVSHFFMLPFLFVIILTLYYLLRFFISNRHLVFISMLVLLADPVLMTQSVIVSPDIVLIMFMLVTFNGIIYKKELLIVFGSVGLACISMRGMMVMAGIVFFHFLVFIPTKGLWRTVFMLAGRYTPAAALGLIFLLAHWLSKGWIGYHDDSPWAGSFIKVDFAGFLRNIGILLWRLIDLGHIGVFLGLGACFLFARKRAWKQGKLLIILIIALSLFLLPSMLLYKYLNGHRYLMPISVGLSLLFVVLNANLFSLWKAKITGLLVAICLICGNLWIYPDGIAQGWDSTLAHIPFYTIRKEARQWLKSEGIDISEVGTSMPFQSKGRYMDLNNEDNGMHQADLGTSKYILLSNLTNEFSNEEIAIIRSQWKQKWFMKENGIWAGIYLRPD